MSKTLENLGTGDDKKDDTIKGVDPKSTKTATTEGSLVTEWRFRKKQPFYQLTLVGNKDTEVQDSAMAAGRMFVHTIKVRDWKLNLDPNKPVDVLVAKRLLTHDQNGIDFWPMMNVKGEASISDKADLLRKLTDMSVVQLREMMTREEWASVGVVPGESDPMTLIVAIMGKKQIITKGTK